VHGPGWPLQGEGHEQRPLQVEGLAHALQLPKHRGS
jgi:hypothetical protein